MRINKTLKADEQILLLRNREPVRTTDGAHTVTIGEQAIVEGFDYRATAEGTSTILQLLGRTETGARLTQGDDQGLAARRLLRRHARRGPAGPPHRRHQEGGATLPALQGPLPATAPDRRSGLDVPLDQVSASSARRTTAPTAASRPRVYKLDELKELVAYADARGVTLVPELEVPGHSGAAARSLPEIFDAINPESKQPVGMGCMNMSNEDIYPALDTIIGEMCDVFRSSPYFHIGSDEVTSGRLSLHPGYKAFMAKHGLKDDHELADHFIASVCEMVKKHGKKAIKWEGLANTATKDVIIMGWEGNSTVATELLGTRLHDDHLPVGPGRAVGTVEHVRLQRQPAKEGRFGAGRDAGGLGAAAADPHRRTCATWRAARNGPGGRTTRSRSRGSPPASSRSTPWPAS